MCSRKAVQLALFMAAVVAVVAEPPAAYGPPSFAQIPNYNIGYHEQMRQTYHDQNRYQYRGSQRQYNVGYQEPYNNAPQPFSFQYEVKDPQSGNDYGHHASSNGNQVKGQYYVLLPDGRRQVVTYVADDNGYNANVHYEGEATVPHQGGYGGYSGNQYNGHRGNNGGYRGNNGGYSGNNGRYNGNVGGYSGNAGGFAGHNGGYRGDFGGFQGGFGGYRY